MKKRTVIKNVPLNYPTQSTLIGFLALDHWKAAGWVWGATITVLTLLWIGVIIAKCNEERIDLDEFSSEGQSNIFKTKRQFKDRVEQLAKEREATK